MGRTNRCATNGYEDRTDEPLAAASSSLPPGFALGRYLGASAGEAIGEGWDRPVYWQIGLPAVFAIQLAIAILPRKRSRSRRSGFCSATP